MSAHHRTIAYVCDKRQHTWSVTAEDAEPPSCGRTVSPSS